VAVFRDAILESRKHSATSWPTLTSRFPPVAGRPVGGVPTVDHPRVAVAKRPLCASTLDRQRFCSGTRTRRYVIRSEDQFTLNVTLVVILLTMTAFLYLFVQVAGAGPLLGITYIEGTVGGALLRIFFHTGLLHFGGNVISVLLAGLVLSVFARPYELGAVLGSGLAVNVFVYHVWLTDVIGLSLLGFAIFAATGVFLLAGFVEVRSLESRLEQAILVVLTAAFIVGLVAAIRAQLWHDILVFLGTQEATYGGSNYTSRSSLAHVAGFTWGLTAAVLVQAYRYRDTLGETVFEETPF